MARPVSDAELQDEVAAAVRAALTELGPERAAELDRGGIAARFQGRGVSKATIQRYIAKAALAHFGRPRNAKDAAAKRAVMSPAKRKRAEDVSQARAVRRHVLKRQRKTGRTDPEDKADVAAELVGELLPAPIDVDEIIAIRGTVGVLDHLRECVGIAQSVIQHAKQEDGKPRNPKMLLAASEHMRRIMDTVQRVHERTYAVERIEEFNRLVIEEVRKESSDCAQRILGHLERLSRQFGAI